MIVESYIELGIVPSDVNEEELKNDFSDALGTYYNVSGKQMKMSKAFSDLFGLAKKYHMILPQNLVLFMKGVATSESLGEKLDPNYNFIQSCKPYVKELMKKKKEPKYIIKALKENAFNYYEFFKDFPEKFNKLTRNKEKMELNINEKALMELRRDLDVSLVRSTLGMLAAGLAIAGALTIQTDIQPYIFNIPWISTLFFILAFIVGIYILIKTRK